MSENVISAFSVDHAARVTQLSKSRLTRWDKLGFFSPEHAGEDRRSPYSRVYSFRDLVGLRTLKLLADKYRVPLPELKRTAEVLNKQAQRPWSEIRLSVLNRRVVFEEPETRTPRNVTDGQYVANCIPLHEVAQEVRGRADELMRRNPQQVGSVERHKFIARNAWVLAGTRIPVAAVHEFADAGYSPEQIMAEFPMLTREDVTAALEHWSDKQAA